MSRIPPALISRFRQGIYFFDLPTAEARKQIWDVYLTKYGVEPDVDPATFDEGWTGREIEQCVTTAYNENVPLSIARLVVVPQCIAAANDVERLRKLANKRFLSSAEPGFYQMPPEQTGGRQFNLAS